ncbi:MAG TPA: OB-fold nucleic acid binding domain-containing protein, partial [Thermoanaerobaculia bacterium]|nr:OB-fold nucleic acid binding domain-containing protein [Thermoanaerobaculia bacterium]
MASSAWARPWCGHLGVSDLGRAVELVGWVRRRRDLGGLVFADLRDRSGIVQLVFEDALLR